MTNTTARFFRLLTASMMLLPAIAVASPAAADTPEIRTPPPPREPRINGPSVFGVRPGHPFLYHIPATGDRPMEFSAKKSADGLTLDPATGEHHRAGCAIPANTL